MIQIKDKKKCVGCTSCFSICPKNCIKMISDEEGFFYPSVDSESCINCGLCEKVCLFNRQKFYNDDFSDYAIGAVNKNATIREKSSSGGMFSLIAEYILSHGGIVFGACIDEKMKVRHRSVEKIEDLQYLRGSKYVQSEIKDIFMQVKNYLITGRLVLFSGTACQVSGLIGYLGIKYSNLICVDVACYGVASPWMFEKYLEVQEKKAKSKVTNISFRDKCSGWRSYSVRIKFIDKKDYLKKAYEDWYMRAYLSKLYLRPSCYECPVKGIKREADITLADFWGLENILPYKDDNKGCSLVIIHSENGRNLIDMIREQADIFEVDKNIAIKYNKAIVESAFKPKGRERFINEMITKGFLKTVKKFCGESLVLKVKIRIKTLLLKFILTK